MKHMGGKWSGDDSECDDCGTWWRAKQWREGSWWGKHCRSDDGWKPGTGLRAGKCMVHQCGWQLKKCRWDMTCREAVQCAIGAWARDIPRRPLAPPRPRLSRDCLGRTARRAFLAFSRFAKASSRNARQDASRSSRAFVSFRQATLTVLFFCLRPRRVRHGRRRRVPRVRVPVRAGQPQRRHRGPLLLRPGQELHARDVGAISPRRREEETSKNKKKPLDTPACLTAERRERRRETRRPRRERRTRETHEKPRQLRSRKKTTDRERFCTYARSDILTYSRCMTCE